MRMWRKTWLPGLVCLSLIWILCHSCMTFRMSRKELQHFLDTKTSNGSHHFYTTESRTLHYAQAGDTTKPLMLFVHGSPGSLSAFTHFLTDSVLTAQALLITADRPGFGHAGLGVAEPSLELQAKMLKPILEKYQNNRPIVLIGHSLGGPVVARMAMDFPDLVDGLVLVAPSIDPDLEPNEMWFRAPLATPFLSWILPRSFRASNEEIYHLKPQLEELKSQWKKISCPVTVVQGGKDSFVPAGNANFAQAELINTNVKVVLEPNANHFIPWNRPELIRQAILEFLPDKPAGVYSNE